MDQRNNFVNQNQGTPMAQNQGMPPKQVQGAPMNSNQVQGLSQFLNQYVQVERPEQWQIEKERFLEVNLNGNMFAKLGSMVAYYGNVKFEHAGSGSIEKYLKKKFTGEQMPIMTVSGQGRIYFSDNTKNINVLYLNNERIYINGRDCLAFDNTLDWDIEMIAGASVITGTGLFAVELTGIGRLAMTSYGDPLVLPVSPQFPIYADPQSVIAWSAGLQTDIKTDINVKTLIGKTSGESIQMSFQGNGFVIIQAAG